MKYIIAILLLIASITFSQATDYDGNAWNTWTDTEKTKYVEGFIVGTLDMINKMEKYRDLLYDQEIGKRTLNQAYIGVLIRVEKALGKHVFWRVEIRNLIYRIGMYYAYDRNCKIPLYMAIYISLGDYDK